MRRTLGDWCEFSPPSIGVSPRSGKACRSSRRAPLAQRQTLTVPCSDGSFIVGEQIDRHGLAVPLFDEVRNSFGVDGLGR
jgi:hypothetical protein